MYESKTLVHRETVCKYRALNQLLRIVLEERMDLEDDGYLSD